MRSCLAIATVAAACHHIVGDSTALQLNKTHRRSHSTGYSPSAYERRPASPMHGRLAKDDPRMDARRRHHSPTSSSHPIGSPSEHSRQPERPSHASPSGHSRPRCGAGQSKPQRPTHAIPSEHSRPRPGRSGHHHSNDMHIHRSASEPQYATPPQHGRPPRHSNQERRSSGHNVRSALAGRNGGRGSKGHVRFGPDDIHKFEVTRGEGFCRNLLKRTECSAYDEQHAHHHHKMRDIKWGNGEIPSAGMHVYFKSSDSPTTWRRGKYETAYKPTENQIVIVVKGDDGQEKQLPANQVKLAINVSQRRR